MGPSAGGPRWSAVVSLAVAVAMAAIAVITVERAGCPDPGHYVARDGGYELVGGCVDPDDLPVVPDPGGLDTGPALGPAAPDSGSPLRP